MMQLLNEYAREIMTSQVDSGCIDLRVRGFKVNAELATTTEARNRGLMHRQSMNEDDGMLFVFPDTDYRSFWMENTFIPLSIAYLTEAGKIINIERMHPFNRTSVRSTEPAKYALEMNAGWFKKRGVQVGDVVSGISSMNESMLREYVRTLLIEQSG